MTPLRPCLDCGRLTTRSRCKTCTTRHDAHYGRAWRKQRAAILHRDHHACTCTGCATCDGHPCHRTATTVDHAAPLAHGGTTHPGNLRAMCGPCNSAKRDRIT